MWSNIILWVSEKVFLDEINIYISVLGVKQIALDGVGGAHLTM